MPCIIIMNPIVVLLGNDGVGKTTIANALQDLGLTAIERTSVDTYGIDIANIDRLTLQYSFEFPSQFPGNATENERRVQYVVLDLRPEMSDRRVSQTREVRDKWETPRSLFYYYYKYREIAAFYGLPLVNCNEKSVSVIANEILGIVRNNHATFPLQGVNTAFIRQHDLSQNEELLTKIGLLDLNESTDYVDAIKIPSFVSSKLDADQLSKLHAMIRVRYLLKHATISFDFDTQHMLKIEHHSITFWIPWHSHVVLVPFLEGESKILYKIHLNRLKTANLFHKSLSNESLSNESLSNENDFVPFDMTLELDDLSDVMSRSDIESDNVLLIQLKPSIYSHSKQSTGMIDGLEKIRARSTVLFLEQLRRNGISHAYRAVNEDGFILADLVGTWKLPGSPLEIVITGALEGTDKHSYYGLKPYVVETEADSTLTTGPYCRFDWRNPNHLIGNTNPADELWYYPAQQLFGDSFFSEVVEFNCRPLGDKTISSDLVSSFVNVDHCRQLALKAFFTMQHYLNQMGLKIVDVCFMMSNDGSVLYSELNQDCMRVVPCDRLLKQSYDKDIWRAGGSSAASRLVLFNDRLDSFFSQHRYYKTDQLLYSQLAYFPFCKTENVFGQNANTRRFILTLDLFDQKPVLVRKGVVTQTHSNGDVAKAVEMMSIVPDLLVVDLNRAMSRDAPDHSNRHLIQQLAKKYFVNTGGGIRTIQDVQDMLSNSVRRVVVSSNIDPAFLKQIPPDRFIVECSIDSNGNVLTFGRSVCLGKTAVHIVRDLLDAGVAVNAISITLHSLEGEAMDGPAAFSLSTKQMLSQLVLDIPLVVTKIIIAGGVTCIDDMEFLWSLPRVIPQLGSAVWTGQLSLGSIYAAMSAADVIPGLIQEESGRVKGLIYMSKSSMQKTVDTRQLYRWSRKHHRVMLKGETSGSFQMVTKVMFDCDNNAIQIVVSAIRQDKPFCHCGKFSCFNDQSVVKVNLLSLKDHIKSQMNKPSYTGVMQRTPSLALAKVLEEFWEIVTASSFSSSQCMTEECSDFLVHFIMYLNGIGMDLGDILNELNARRWDPHLLQSPKRVASNTIMLGITSAKYGDKTDRFCLDHLGFAVKRGAGRSLTIGYEIVNTALFEKHFGNRSLILLGSRPKDLPWLMASNRIQMAISYNTVFENAPKVFSSSFEVPDMDLRLCLIKCKEQVIDCKTWTHETKVLIAAEHPAHVSRFLQLYLEIDPHTFTLDRIIGSSEAFLVAHRHTLCKPNEPLVNRRYILCDAIVESGKTLIENDLEIWETVLPFGQVTIGLYKR